MLEMNLSQKFVIKKFVPILRTESLSGLKIPKVVLPKFEDYGEILSWVYKENVPGSFPYTAGVFPFKREGEDPKRQFAGEGTPERTNRRFHYLSKDDDAKRLSTAFDSVTLYGEDPDDRPDIYGKVGESGVSICTLDDMKKLYDGFDLCAPSTSVSMTINGPAPIILAMFMNTAIDQQVRIQGRRTGTHTNCRRIYGSERCNAASSSWYSSSGYFERRSRTKYLYFLYGICTAYDGGYSTIFHRSKSA